MTGIMRNLYLPLEILSESRKIGPGTNFKQRPKENKKQEIEIIVELYFVLIFKIIVIFGFVSFRFK